MVNVGSRCDHTEGVAVSGDHGLDGRHTGNRQNGISVKELVALPPLFPERNMCSPCVKIYETLIRLRE
jgi:hypothetical protein